MLKKFKFIIISFVCLFSILAICIGVTKAALPGDEGLTLSPPIKELTIKPGESSTQTLRLTNPTGKIVELYPKVMNFSAKGDSGEPGFTPATDETAKFSLANWIKLTSSKIALTPEQVVEYKYDIVVPQDAEAGGHYGVVFFATEPPKNDNSSESKVSLSSMVGSLVLVKVPGDINESGSLESLSINKFFHFDNNTSFTSKIHNSGNIHFKPHGDITVKSIFGSEVDKMTFNEQGGNILPDSTRKFENKWKSNKFLLGIYSARLHAVYGDTDKNLDKTISFVIIPWWILIIILVVLITLIFFLVRWRLKRRNKRGPKKPKGPMQGGPTQGGFGQGGSPQQGQGPSGKVILR